MSRDHVFERKVKEAKPVLAICYDFDRTLSPDDMQAQGYIQSVGYDVEKFWQESNERAEKNDMDSNVAYMYKMIEEAEGRFAFNRETLMDYGSKVALFPGVEEWFERIRKYGAEHDVIVEHYINFHSAAKASAQIGMKADGKRRFFVTILLYTVLEGRTHYNAR